ncbi:helix-hairpin-helix domain-containing protein [Flavihumibacter rivuli]|uniref:DNA polymerase/3'-5' exonuclease PolX n=1 Tax=Flavihumibacter rivuli TaxID=2838156 RepID=UPI001BDEFDBA|nr:DNA polymerase/3'-5' exonuclease PolX [Flavihumibacter rivuli]ULQ56933.1 helix-hairpin-helix domain-containing protein [Flavihumibacter rivuli]
MDNYAIADQFSLLSKLMDIHGENSFKAKSYATAAFNIEKLPLQLSDTPREKIAGMKGIGDSSAKKIMELLDTGKLQVLVDLVAQTPPGVLEMLNIKGLGPKKIATIWKEMGIESLGELLYACNENRLLMYKGFGEKTQESVKQSINFYLHNKGHFLFAEIESYANQVLAAISKQFPDHHHQLAGEIRRQANTITALQLITTTPLATLEQFLQQQNFSCATTPANELEATGPEGARMVFIGTSKDKFVTDSFTSSCSREFLDQLKARTGFDDNREYPDEGSIFETLGLPFIPDYQRDLPALLDKAIANSLPEPIMVQDIRGIIHSHSNWSDGLHTIEEMAKGCISKGYEYLVISDHSRSAGYANGLSVERIREQHAYIDELNARLEPFKIFKSIECDILGDGSLDYPDDVLAGFDLVIASVHSNLKMTAEKAMQRLLRAIEHPATTILGHMTGRLLLSRPGYPIDHEQVIDACVKHKVVLEINAHPRRLDIDYSWIPYAMEKGALLSINPDAHQVEGFDDVRYGVISARKGGLTAASNLSSFNLAAFETFLSANRKI